MITRKFWNCSSSRLHQGVSGALLSRFGPYCSRRSLRLGSAQAARQVGAERRDHRLRRLAVGGRGLRRTSASSSGAAGCGESTASCSVDFWCRFTMESSYVHGFRNDGGVRRRWSGRVGRMCQPPLVLAVRAFHQPHHLIGIDLRGDANSEEGESPGDVPVGHSALGRRRARAATRRARPSTPERRKSCSPPARPGRSAAFRACDHGGEGDQQGACEREFRAVHPRAGSSASA